MTARNNSKAEKAKKNIDSNEGCPKRDDGQQ